MRALQDIQLGRTDSKDFLNKYSFLRILMFQIKSLGQ